MAWTRAYVCLARWCRASRDRSSSLCCSGRSQDPKIRPPDLSRTSSTAIAGVISICTRQLLLTMDSYTRALKVGRPQVNGDGSINRVTGTYADARPTAARRNVAMLWRTLKARHNRLGETIVGLRNIVMPIHTSRSMCTAYEKRCFFAMTSSRLQQKSIGLLPSPASLSCRLTIMPGCSCRQRQC